MTLVHVPARGHFRVDLAQQQRQLGIALEVEHHGIGLPAQQGKHLAVQAVDQNFRAEGGIFGGGGEAEQVIPHGSERYQGSLRLFC